MENHLFSSSIGSHDPSYKRLKTKEMEGTLEMGGTTCAAGL